MQVFNEYEMLKVLERNAHPCAEKQYGKHAIAGFLLVLALNFCGTAWAAEDVAQPGASPDAARRAELVTLVRQDCGSCHGLTLKGGLGPALKSLGRRSTVPVSFDMAIEERLPDAVEVAATT